MVIYYTGTGNSRYAASLIAAHTGDELTDARPYIKEGRNGEFCSDTPWVFVSPTYGWRIPRIFEAFIRKSRFTGCKKAYFIMTCGSEIGNAAVKLKKLCADTGLQFMGVHEAVMPENYVAMFYVPDMAEASGIIAKVVPGLHAAAEHIAHRRYFPAVEATPLDRFKTAAVNPIFYDFFVKSKAFYATDACIGCGKCARDCPTNSITIVNGKPQWGGDCTHCMACICRCPAKAVEYGKDSLGKPRYLCPDYNGE